jgi:hypothetical protein
MIGGEMRERTERTPSHQDAIPSPGGVEFGGIPRLILDVVCGAEW